MTKKSMEVEIGLMRKAASLTGQKIFEKTIDKKETKLNSQNEQRLLDAKVKVEEQNIAKGTENITKQKGKLLNIAGQLEPLEKKLNTLEKREAVLVRSRSERRLGVTVDSNVQKKLDEAFSSGLSAAKSVLSGTVQYFI